MTDPKMLDTADYYELLLKHLTRDPKTLKRANEVGLKSEDFQPSTEYGLNIYKEFADIILTINKAPLELELFLLHIKDKLNNGRLNGMHMEQIAKLITWLYQGDTTPDYFADNLREFVKRRRQEKAKSEAKDSDDLLLRLSQIAIKLDKDDLGSTVEILNPFETLILPVTYDLIPTGFSAIDTVTGGLARGDYGLIIGYSGSGKTAAGTFICGRAAEKGYQTAYVSMEETMQNAAMRFYSRYFSLDYSQLRSGALSSSLQDKWNDDTYYKGILKDKLKIIGLKGKTPVTADQIEALLLQEFEKNGFSPDLVVLDQMQFMCPRTDITPDQRWQSEDRISTECDELSHKQIGGKSFALWVLHQAKGKIKEEFSREEIQGFKGIDQKADVVWGIGRKDQHSSDFTFFSLKSRHSPNFRIRYRGDLQFMTYEEVATNIAPEENRMQSDLPLSSAVVAQS
jgi:replicative DNA helicase